MSKKILIMPLLCGIFFLSCKKPVIEEDTLLPPDNLAVQFTDTLQLETFTGTQDSLIGTNLAINLLGGMDDPVFGKTYAGFYTQLALPNNNIDLGNTLEFDSLVLTLKYVSTYGDMTDEQNIIVKEMTEQIDPEQEYYTNRTFSTDASEIGRINNFNNDITDSVVIDGENLGSVIRIRLNDNIGEDLLNQSGTINFSSSAAFQSYFNGLYIGPDESNTGKGMYYIDLADPVSVLTLYYNDTSTLDFLINNQTVSVESFSNDQSNAPVENYINNGSKNDSLIFVQSMATTKAIIRIPELLQFENIIINKAELVLTEVPNPFGFNSGEDFLPPNFMVAFGSDSSGTAQTVADQFVSASYFGGQASTTTINGVEVNQYKINLARHYQFVLDERKEDFGIFILPLPSNRIADRVVLGGGNHSSARAKLNLTYTKIE